MSFVAGASAAIMKTMKEIESILEGEHLLVAGPKRTALREKLQSSLIRSSKTWYRKGFSRGHKESFRESKLHRRVPSTLTTEVARQFLPGSKVEVRLQSTLSKSFRNRF
jgi:hypothetical protein